MSSNLTAPTIFASPSRSRGFQERAGGCAIAAVKWRDDFADGGSKVPLQLIELIGANPFLTPRETERRLGVSYNTVMRAIEALKAGGVVAKVGDSKRDRVFCARAILDILDEPARLVPQTTSTIRRPSRG